MDLGDEDDAELAFRDGSEQTLEAVEETRGAAFDGEEDADVVGESGEHESQREAAESKGVALEPPAQIAESRAGWEWERENWREKSSDEKKAEDSGDGKPDAAG